MPGIDWSCRHSLAQTRQNLREQLTRLHFECEFEETRMLLDPLHPASRLHELRILRRQTRKALRYVSFVLWRRRLRDRIVSKINAVAAALGAS